MGVPRRSEPIEVGNAVKVGFDCDLNSSRSAFGAYLNFVR